MTHLFIQAHVVLRHLYIANDRGDTRFILGLFKIMQNAYSCSAVGVERTVGVQILGA